MEHSTGKGPPFEQTRCTRQSHIGNGAHLQQWSRDPKSSIASNAMFGLVPGQTSLHATGCFCEISDDFASIAVEMLFNMMESSSVSLLLKLTTARVFAKCKSSYSVAHKVYKTGLELVLNSSDEDILAAMLFSLSKLASISMLITSSQLDFLLSFLNRERTSHVQETALKCLHFLFRKGLYQHPVNSGLIHGLFSIMEEPKVSLALQCEALRVLHKVLLCILTSLLHVVLRECLKLLAVAENEMQYSVSMKSLLAIHILADLCCWTVGGADIDNGVFCCSSLPSRVISLIKEHIKLLVMPFLDACQNDLTICQDLQRLLKILLAIVERHPYLGSLALDNIEVVIEFLVNVASTDHVLSTRLAVNFKAEKKNSFILKLLHKIYRFLAVCLENLYKSGAINTEVLNRVKILVELVCHCSLIDCYTYTMYYLLLHSQPISGGLVHENDETHDYLNLSIYPHSFVKCKFDTVEFVNKVLTGTDGWTAYKVGAHAACQGEWLIATSIFKTLIEKVKSDSCCSWLKALFHYAYSEGIIQLLSLPKQGTTTMKLLENIEFPSTFCDYMDESETDPRIFGHMNDCRLYCDKLTASHLMWHFALS